MPELLKKLADNAKEAIDEGAYDLDFTIYHSRKRISDAIRSCEHAAIISEIKFSSPSLGMIRNYSNPVSIAKEMVDAGAVALSILTQPKMFNGSIDYLVNVRIAVDLPLLMKDIVISDLQIDAGRKAGADTILLISSLFNAGLCEGTLDGFIDKAHKHNLEVLLEVHNIEEFREAVKSRADLIGINNRDLDTMHVDIRNTENILRAYTNNNYIIVSESGIDTPEDIRYLKDAGADAFLVGTSLMKSDNIKTKLRELVMAL